jgi:hypothetical protein
MYFTPVSDEGHGFWEYEPENPPPEATAEPAPPDDPTPD